MLESYHLMAEITMAKQLLASEPCRLPACLLNNQSTFGQLSGDDIDKAIAFHLQVIAALFLAVLSFLELLTSRVVI